MKILVFCIVPLFPDHDMGGATKHLRYIVNHLGAGGHQVTVLCTRHSDSHEAFNWHENVRVLPILRFKQPFPAPYDTGAHNLATIVQDIDDHLQDADCFYIHDGEMLFPYLTEGIPTVVGLRDNVYPETIMGSFLFQADTLIVISPYARRFVQATAGRFFPALNQRLKTIPNGMDWGHFKPTEPHKILDIVNVDPAQHAIVLHPHRPEASKGIFQTIAAADRLIKHHRIDNLRVVVPRWLGLNMDAGVQEFYEQVETRLAELNIREHFVFHDWVPYDLLPEYYSLGDVAFSLGHFVESFGNAVYEALGCGTPSIAARIATHRELLPDDLLDKVDYDDPVAAADRAAAIIRGKIRTSDETLAYLRTHYDFKNQLAAYAETIENAKIAQRMPYISQPRTDDTPYVLAPWCYVAARGIYHDFRADYQQIEALTQLLAQQPFTPLEAAAQGVTGVTFEDWYRDGYIVPRNG